MNDQICLDCGATCDPICMTCPSCGSWSLTEHTDDPTETCSHDTIIDISEDGLSMCLACGRTWDDLGSE